MILLFSTHWRIFRYPFCPSVKVFILYSGQDTWISGEIVNNYSPIVKVRFIKTLMLVVISNLIFMNLKYNKFSITSFHKFYLAVVIHIWLLNIECSWIVVFFCDCYYGLIKVALSWRNWNWLPVSRDTLLVSNKGRRPVAEIWMIN